MLNSPFSTCFSWSTWTIIYDWSQCYCRHFGLLNSFGVETWSSMRRSKIVLALARYVAMTAIMVAFSSLDFAATYKVLHAFSGKPDGGGLFDRLALDGSGSLFGTTWGGGAYGYGTVFQLTRNPAGAWNESILYSFCSDPPECHNGVASFNGVSLDAAGNLYGTVKGGAAGFIFQLAPMEPGSWRYTLIYDQGSTGDVTVDGAGNLYGEVGLGKCNAGEILKLKPPPPGGDGWTAKDLYDFCPHNNRWNKGNSPNYGLTGDSAGNLYGVTYAGGKQNFGVAFQLEHTPSGWKEHVLHSFAGAPDDGRYAWGGVAVDAAGNVYGATVAGGSERCGGPGCGTIYKLTRQPDGKWKETILYRFPKLDDGAAPIGALTMDPAGNLYGVAGGSSKECSCGVVFKFAHNPNDTWTYSVLHRFHGTDGALPVAGVILDAKGNIYGTTSTGGKGGYGVVFKITQ